ncbi:MAG: hypothetical protein ACRDOP_13665, partial [Gaiellaceae bacterium]
EAHIRIAEKWDGRLPTPDRGTVDWRQRALRAEAEAAAAKGEAVSAQMKYEAIERVLDEVETSISWRLTAPLRGPRRLLNRRRNRRR